MIPFVFFIIVVMFLLLIVAVIINNEFLGLLSAMGIMAVGVHILSSGMENIVNTLTLALGIICVCFGAYVFITGLLDKIEEML